MKTAYGFGKTVTYPFAEAVDKTTQELAKEGFGVLTQIDVAATMKKKLDKEMPAQLILGACNPVLAHQALTAEPSIGLLLPCNVVVRESASGQVQVEILDPNMMGAIVDNSEVNNVAQEARQRLERVLQAL